MVVVLLVVALLVVVDVDILLVLVNVEVLAVVGYCDRGHNTGALGLGIHVNVSVHGIGLGGCERLRLCYKQGSVAR